VRLQFVYVHSFAWPNLGGNFSGADFYCVAISWEQIFIGSLQAAIVGVLPQVAFEHWCHA